MKRLIPILCTILAALCFLSSAFASDPLVLAPNRAPDVSVLTPWQTANLWDLETQDVRANCDSHPFAVRPAPAGTLAVTRQTRFHYRYRASAFLGASAPPTGFVNGSWNMATLAHRENVIAGPGYNDPECPIPTGYIAIDAPTAGAPANLVFAASTPGLTQASLSIFQGPTPIYQDRGLWDVGLWSEVNGVRNGREYKTLWVTYATDPAAYWFPLSGTSDYGHSISYECQMDEAIELRVWYVTAQDVANSPLDPNTGWPLVLAP